MKKIRHVCQAGTAAERVHALTGGDVLAIADDASVGPLHDIDLPVPRLRAAFWEAVFNGDPDMAGMDWHRELGQIRYQLSILLREGDEIVIWAGHHPTEQLLRRRIHGWLQDISTPVYEVQCSLDDTQPEAGGATGVMPIAMIPPDILCQRYQERRLVSAGLQRQLASEWEGWLENGKGIRTLKNGVLTESVIESIDPAILSLFSQRALAPWHRSCDGGNRTDGCAVPLAYKNTAVCRLAQNGRGRDQPVFVSLIRNGPCPTPHA
ncbi:MULTISPECIES: DUF1835 domain-containing protein [Enterobacteriaceae]|uniref:DUF1835 domain-containing protein n=1 Tax=Enterobacteriaceae TaxID=543 RepID=UPI00132F12ED|nr:MULTISPECIES: DUF1835 domain-containing protein [Enterobacteriaceae]HCM9383525.1 DUF1835 domain-containing protein [Enterobacter hormaechei subsp. xiangfangensis]EJK8939086.1 DUF1835 domain-containing protein [Enterobacter hormaechei]EKS6616928.1 DUF1835 domain-containing protein [Enterobacter hormaechei]EKU3258018.1 DUF1835 domain-containing protein [Enterobacter hormaechei]EKV5720056.1 DUF1835 domain-containing protein [Enterobacter hormaechei]